MLVGFGQMICKPVGPRCDLCDVAKVPRLCPSKKAVSPRKGAKKEDVGSPKVEVGEASEVKEEDEGRVKAEVVVKAEELVW